MAIGTAYVPDNFKRRRLPAPSMTGLSRPCGYLRFSTSGNPCGALDLLRAASRTYHIQYRAALPLPSPAAVLTRTLSTITLNVYGFQCRRLRVLMPDCLPLCLHLSSRTRRFPPSPRHAQWLIPPDPLSLLSTRPKREDCIQHRT